MSARRHIDHLPLRVLGFKDIPAIPVELDQVPGTLLRLGLRAEQTKQSTQGLSNVYTLGGVTAPAYPFLFGESSPSEPATEGAKPRSLLGRLVSGAKEAVEEAAGKVEDVLKDGAERVLGALHLGRSGCEQEVVAHRADLAAEARAELERRLEASEEEVRELLRSKVADEDPRPLAATRQTALTSLSLDDPRQFSMSWTTFFDVYRHASPLLEPFAAAIEDPDEASRAFWPTIARYGLAYNLLIVEKVGTARAEQLAAKLGAAWSPELAELQAGGGLYLIDLGLFETLQPQPADGSERFTPATLTLLRQDAQTKTLTPIAVRVAGHNGSGARLFTRASASAGAWLWALQAAKVSITVYGIWLGHVYHWHIVTAAMQMTFLNTIPEKHPLQQLVAPQSQYLIPFDNVLLLLWEHIAPPTSLTSANQFVELCNTFAHGREYFDDDPTTTLRKLGIVQADFSVERPWDQYPIVGRLLAVWHAVEEYVGVFVETTWPDDAAVAADRDLQEWMRQAADKDGGNVRGLPAVDTRAALARVLTSLLYRVTAHGTGRLLSAANPGLTFVGNYPPCLQKAQIPDPAAPIDRKELLSYLPTTGTIGKMVNFYFTFSFSAPYEPFVPLDGIGTGLFFGSDPQDPRNQALLRLRERILTVMSEVGDGAPQVNQWPLNIET